VGADLFQPLYIGSFIDTGKCDSKKAHECTFGVRRLAFGVRRLALSPFVSGFWLRPVSPIGRL
jgi:hypothetical protein